MRCGGASALRCPGAPPPPGSTSAARSWRGWRPGRAALPGEARARACDGWRRVQGIGEDPECARDNEGAGAQDGEEHEQIH